MVEDALGFTGMFAATTFSGSKFQSSLFLVVRLLGGVL